MALLYDNMSHTRTAKIRWTEYSEIDMFFTLYVYAYILLIEVRGGLEQIAIGVHLNYCG